MTSLVMISVLKQLSSTNVAKKRKASDRQPVLIPTKSQQQDEPEVTSSSDTPAKELVECMFGERRPQVEEKCDEYTRVEFLQTVVKR